MWLQTCIVVCVLMHLAFALPDFRYRSDFNVVYLEKDAFAEYYLKDDGGFRPVELSIKPKDFNYFPKCCPPGFSYGTQQHNCVNDQDREIRLLKITSGNVNLVKTAMDGCEVIVDHLIELNDLDVDDDTLAVSFHGKQIAFGQYCLDYAGTQDNSSVVVRECRNKDYCLSRGRHDVCIKKCCPDGYQFINKRCTRNPIYGMDVDTYTNIVEDYNGSFAVYHQTSTCRKYIWKHEGGLKITFEGTLIVDTNVTYAKYTVDQEMYCTDGNMMINENYSVPVFLLCIDENTNDFVLSRIVLLISCVCLLLTVIVFIIIAKVRSLMGKIVTTYSTTMFTAFLMLLTVQFQPPIDNICKPVGYGILFMFTATFSWMNVMCYEIWKTLGMMKSGIPNEKQKKVFLKYNMYGWGIPITLVLLAFIFNTVRMLPDEIHPFIGEKYCILENRVQENLYGHTLFMALPQAIMLSINGFLFIGTLRHFWKIKEDMTEVQSDESMEAKRKKMKIQKYDVRRFVMVTKLFIIMGLSWIFEVISALIDFKQHPTWAVIERVFDTFNCLQGVLIFCVFVLNKKTLQRLLRRCASKKKIEEDEKFSSITSSVFSAEQQEMTPQAS